MRHSSSAPGIRITPVVLLVAFLYLLCANVSAQPDREQSELVSQNALADWRSFPLPGDGPETEIVSYEASFIGLDRSLIGRAGLDPTALVNNDPASLNIAASSIDVYRFTLPTASPNPKAKPRSFWKGTDEESEDNPISDIENETALHSKRQTSVRAVYVTINTCLQPSSLQNRSDAVPQLNLYVTNTSNVVPGPTFRGFQLNQTLQEGFANITITTSNQITIAIAAPTVNIPAGEGQVWNYEVAASIDGPFHSYDESSNIFMNLIDSDPQAGLLVTTNLTNLAANSSSQASVGALLQNGPPLSVFVSNINSTAIRGMRHSFCGLKHASPIYSNLNPPTNIESGITYNQPSKKAEQRIYVPDLTRASTFYGILALNGNGTNQGGGIIGGGGRVFPIMNFTTKRDPNCAIIYNLTFCSSVEYAVPANPFRFPNLKDLANIYDQNASALYQNFNYSLQQIPCNTTSTSQYSLVKNCDDCAAAYRTWLCAVTIPRCEDFTLPDPSSGGSLDANENQGTETAYLMPRNLAQAPIEGANIPDGLLGNATQLGWLATNSSRNNATIAGLIQPGPYREVLPCEDLCYDLVRSCPAALGFGCPDPDSKLLKASYGQRLYVPGGGVTCNAPGNLYFRSGSSSSRRQDRKMLVMTLIVSAFLAAWY